MAIRVGVALQNDARPAPRGGHSIDQRIKPQPPIRDIFGPFPPGPGLGLDRVVDDILNAFADGAADAGGRFLAELAEWANWQRILEARPDLEPAVESEIRGVADGMAGRLDLSRTDQLRILGNGVVPAQAAAAIGSIAVGGDA